MLSPLTREESCTSRFTTWAPRRLAASSKDTRVRVDGSVKRLATVMPASAGSWRALAERAHETLGPLEQPLEMRARQAFERQQMTQRPIGAQLLLAPGYSILPLPANQRPRITAAAALSMSLRRMRRALAARALRLERALASRDE